MPGMGPPPKPAHRRARTNADVRPATTLRFVRGEQPPLPVGFEWHERTREWWAMWGRSPQSEHFMESDWDFLLDTALMHAAMWAKGQWTLAAEVRLRVAKYGATPEDRARLRMTFADADAKDGGVVEVGASRARYAGLRAVVDPA